MGRGLTRLAAHMPALRTRLARRRPWSLLSLALTIAAVVTVAGMIVLANRMLAVAFGASAFAVTALWLSDRGRARRRRRWDDR